MLAYMNRESLRRRWKRGETWFWSRSRGELWHKGATSGHTQQVASIRYDCDGDALLVEVEQSGPACHTGRVQLFLPGASTDGRPGRRGGENYGDPKADPSAKLEAIIAERDAERPEGRIRRTF